MSNEPERFPAIRITMLPKDTNAYGTIFGGVILSYIDLAGGIEARRQSPKKFVTKAMQEVVFVAPVYLGDLVTFYTRTIRIGKTSITVDVEVEAERLGLRRHQGNFRVTEAEVIYVAVDEDGPSHVRNVTNEEAGLCRRRDELYFSCLSCAARQHHSPSGMLTNAVLGYLRTLFGLSKNVNPNTWLPHSKATRRFAALCFQHTKRHASGHRTISKRSSIIAAGSRKLSASPALKPNDYEADDVIGTIAMRMVEVGHPVVIVTGDKDMSQLVATTYKSMTWRRRTG